MIKHSFSLTLASCLLGAIAYSQTTSVLVSTGYNVPPPDQVAPGQVVTLFYRGIPFDANGQPRSARAEAPLPTELAGLTAQIVQQSSLWNVPLIEVRQQN